MIDAKIPIENIDVQLSNSWVTTPATVRFHDDHIDVEIVYGNKECHFEFALVEQKIRLIVREMSAQGVIMSMAELHDFRNPHASNNAMQLTVLRSASDGS